MLDVRRLRVLGAVARHGSFSAAAAALGYTQPAVSRQVALLEAETGTLLVRRLPQGIQLTDAGRLLVQRGEAIIAQLDGLEAELGALAGLEGGRLRFGAFASACASIVPLAIARFRDRHPAVELSVRIVEPEESLPTLRAGELDLAISNDPHSASPRAAARTSAHTVKADGYAVDAVPHGAGAGAGGAATSAHAGGTGAHGASTGLHGGGTGPHGRGTGLHGGGTGLHGPDTDPDGDGADPSMVDAGPHAVEAIHLFDDPMYVALPASHPLADAESLSMESLAVEPWMIATANTCPDSRLLARACHAAGFEPRVAFENDDYSVILGFVAAGVGIALIPDMVTRGGVRDDVVVRALEAPSPARPIFAVLPAGYRSPAAAAMLDVLHEMSRDWVADRPALAGARGRVELAS